MRLNKKGFTLIELLAVIVVLGIILAIAIPKVTNSIEDSKKSAFNVSVKSYIKAAQQYVATKEVEGETVTSGTVEDLNVNNKEGWSGVWTNNNGVITFDQITDGKTTVVGINSANADSTPNKYNDDTILTYSTNDDNELINYYVLGSNPNDNVFREGDTIASQDMYFMWADSEDPDELLAPYRNVIIPYGITEIGELDSWSFTSIIIPNTVQTISYSAFAGTTLDTFILPNSLKTIKSSAFHQSQLTNIIIPSDVNTIEDNAFFGTQYLTKITNTTGESFEWQKILTGSTYNGTEICRDDKTLNNSEFETGTCTIGERVVTIKK